jgi:hypothetical protein
MNYQGKLTDGVTGGPLPGMHNMTFRIYDNAAGGTMLWSESMVVVADSSGVVGATLGSITPIDIAFDAPRWLEIRVDGETLSPRTELVTSPYAFNAANCEMLGGAHSDSYSLVGHTHDDRYFTEEELSKEGTVNDSSNPVDWSKLKNVPPGFADGVDDAASGGINSVLAGEGLIGGSEGGPAATLDIGQGTGITVDADAVALDTTYTDARYHTPQGFGFVAQDEGVTVNETTTETISAQVVIPPGAVSAGVVVTACGFYTAYAEDGPNHAFRGRVRAGPSGTTSDPEYVYADYRSEGMTASGATNLGNLSLTCYIDDLDWAQQNYIEVTIIPSVAAVSSGGRCTRLVVFGY